MASEIEASFQFPEIGEFSENKITEIAADLNIVENMGYLDKCDDQWAELVDAVGDVGCVAETSQSQRDQIVETAIQLVAAVRQAVKDEVKQ